MARKIDGMTGKEWIASQQGRHICQCGCGEKIKVQIHHNVRGIPRFIDGHGSRINNPMEGMIGALNPNYKRGWYINKNGYKLVLVPGPGRSKYILEHRAKFQRHHGVDLDRGELVHHKNGNKVDNRISNLLLMSNSEHSKYHAKRGDSGWALRWKNKKTSNNTD